MFSYIKGFVEYKGFDYFVLENNGIGYKINAPISTIDKLKIGNEEKILTYLQVREDYLGMYGFITAEELKVFELLLLVSGIGPKVANAVLSNISPSKFSLAIITNDVACLKKIPGIGPKTAQRIILELKDKMKKEDILLEDGSEIIEKDDENYTIEAIKVLQVLGYNVQDSKKMLNGIDIVNMQTEDIVKEALKNINKAY